WGTAVAGSVRLATGACQVLASQVAARAANTASIPLLPNAVDMLRIVDGAFPTAIGDRSADATEFELEGHQRNAATEVSNTAANSRTGDSRAGALAGLAVDRRLERPSESVKYASRASGARRG